ncbi:MAG: hypothetical protein JNM18_17785, partial [Planctomycetaceae bacterium]|nr:hypothetical protein [Planctomycetaceae bacterium]
ANDPPVRLSGPTETLKLYSDGYANPIGLNNFAYVGGPSSDEYNQSLTFTLTSVPSPAIGSLVRSSDTIPLTVGSILNYTEFQQMRFIAPQGISGSGSFAFTITDDGTTFGVPDSRSSTDSISFTFSPRTAITLTRDINQLPANSDPTTAVNLNGIAIYTAFDYARGTELWRSDGTPTGTYLLKDIRAGGRSSSITNLTVVGNRVFFAANDVATGTELWSTDGTTAGTGMVSDIFLGTSSSVPANLVNVNGILFFSASNSTNGAELWRSNGASSGTFMVKDIAPGISTSFPSQLTNFNGTLYFSATDSPTGAELWRSDGTSSGTQMVRDISPGSASTTVGNLRVVGSTLLFTATEATFGSELWRTDGTSTGTFLTADITPGTTGSSFNNLLVANNLLFFVTSTTVAGAELWRSDGTTAGTFMLSDIAPGATSSSPGNLATLSNVVYFAATNSTFGNELWRTDGSITGTTMVRDIAVGTTSSTPSNLTAFNNQLYFSASSGSGGTELWRSDGTNAGTVQVADIAAGNAGSSPGNLVATNNYLFFTATDSVRGIELWRTDGTSSNTTLTRDIVTGSVAASISNGMSLGDRILFRANDLVTGRELWTSDGTSAGTILLQDMNPGTTDALPANAVNLNGIVLFETDDGVRGRELWRTDGSQAGTWLVADISTSSTPGGPTRMVNVNGTVYFAAFTSTNGAELWKSDGTSSGTSMVYEFTPGSSGTTFGSFFNVNGTLFLQASSPATGLELWKSDGTSSGTSLVADLVPGASGSTLGSFLPLNNKLLFSFNQTATGNELWITDGTTIGTTQVADIASGTASGFQTTTAPVVLNGIAYFAGNDVINGTELWRTDGTSAGTFMVANINPGIGSSSISNLIIINNKLFFAAFTSALGTELWSSDGTSAGTTIVADIVVGGGSSSPQNLINVNGTLFFTALTSSTGTELFRSDGTSSGTVLVRDITPGPTSSTLSQLTAVGNALFFRTFDSVKGFELWRSDGTCVGTTVVQDLFPGLSDSYPTNLFALGNRLFFQAYDGQVGNELFVFSDNGPTTTGIANRTIGIDAATLGFDLFAAFADDVTLDAGMSYTVVSNTNPALVSAAAINSTTGRLTLTFAGVNTGSATITVRATDSLNQAVETSFTVVRNASLNLAPTLDPLVDRVITEDAALQTVSLSGISAGAGESQQILTITATSSNPSIIPHPTVNYTSPSATGSLSFAPIANVSGMVTITVTVRDDGGAGQGGVDTVVRTFVVNVTEVNDLPVGSNDTLSAVQQGSGVRTIPFTTLLSNDAAGPTNESPQVLTITAVDAPIGGTVAISGTDVIFTPNPSFSGLASFQYTAQDNGTTAGVADPQSTVVTASFTIVAIPSVALAIGNPSLAENAGATTVTATLSNASLQDVTVLLGFGGNATSGTDYSASGTTIFIPAGQTAGSISLSGLNDATFEGNESLTVDILNVTNGLISNGLQQVTTTILDDDSAPSVTLSRSPSIIAENLGTAVVTATLSNPSTQDVTVHLTFSGMATFDVDYTASNTTITIPAGSTSGSLTVVSLDDTLIDANESVIVDVAGVDNGTENGIQQASLNILDDEPLPLVNLTIGSSTFGENAGTAIVTATLNAVSTQNVVVNLAFDGAASVNVDYSSDLTITILAGDTAASLTLTGLNDITYEQDELLTIAIDGVTGGIENGVQQISATISEDDTAPLVNLAFAPSSFSENGGTTSVTATLTNPSTQAVTVNLAFGGAATSGVDYSASGTTIVIPAGSTMGSVTLTGLNDITFEGDESLTVDITSVTNGSENGVQHVTGILSEDDTAPLVNLAVSPSSFGENGGTTTVSARLSNPSTQPVTVQLSFSGVAASGIDFSASATTITIPAGSTIGSITLTGLNDITYESDETLLIDVNGVSGGTENGVQQVAALIVDDDEAPRARFAISSSSAAESAGNVSITVVLTAANLVTTTIPFTIAGTATNLDRTVSASPLVIPAGQTSGIIIVNVVNDPLDELNESVVLQLGTPINATIGSTPVHTLTIVDNDAPPVVQFVALTQAVVESTPTARAIVRLLQPSGLDVTVPITSSGTTTNADASVSTTLPVVIPAGQISAAIDVAITDDTTAEATETLVLTIGTPTNATRGAVNTHTLSIVDNDSLVAVQLAGGNFNVSESVGTVPLSVTLSSLAPTAVTVPIVVSGSADGHDYRLSTTTVTIPAGQTRAIFTLTVTDDQLEELPETLTIQLGTPTGGELGTNTALTVTIDDNDPVLSFARTTDTTSDENGTITVIARSLSPVIADLTVPFTSYGRATLGVDYTLSANAFQ